MYGIIGKWIFFNFALRIYLLVNLSKSQAYGILRPKSVSDTKRPQSKKVLLVPAMVASLFAPIDNIQVGKILNIRPKHTRKKYVFTSFLTQPFNHPDSQYQRFYSFYFNIQPSKVPFFHGDKILGFSQVFKANFRVFFSLF